MDLLLVEKYREILIILIMSAFIIKSTQKVRFSEGALFVKPKGKPKTSGLGIALLVDNLPVGLKAAGTTAVSEMGLS